MPRPAMRHQLAVKPRQWLFWGAYIARLSRRKLVWQNQRPAIQRAALRLPGYAVAQPINKAEVMRAASYMKMHIIAAPQQRFCHNP